MWYRVEIDDINTDPVKAKVNGKEFEITLHDTPQLKSQMPYVEEPIEAVSYTHLTLPTKA